MMDDLHPRCSTCHRRGVDSNALRLGVTITILDIETGRRRTCTAEAEFCHWCRSKDSLETKAIAMCQFAFSDETAGLLAELEELNTEKR